MHFHKHSSTVTLVFTIKSPSPKEQSLSGLIGDLHWGL